MSTKKLFSTDKTDEMKRVLTLFSLTATRCRACQRAQDVKNNAGHGARQKTYGTPLLPGRAVPIVNEMNLSPSEEAAVPPRFHEKYQFPYNSMRAYKKCLQSNTLFLLIALYTMRRSHYALKKDNSPPGKVSDS